MKYSEVSGGRFLVLGAGRSGEAAVKLLLNHGAKDVALADDLLAEDAPVAVRVRALGVRLILGKDTVLAEAPLWPVIIKSPGIPRTHAALVSASERNARIVGELELAFALRPPHAKVIAITGTNGKTTTTAWTEHLLRKSGLRAIAVGNIGLAWAEALLQPEWTENPTVFVVEASSFQLDDIEDFAPDVAVLTNFSPDHLDRYGIIEAYFAAKQRIWQNMGPDGLLILNRKDEPSAGFENGSNCRIGHFENSEAGEQRNSAASDAPFVTLRDSWLHLTNLPRAGDSTPLLHRSDLSLPGPHNCENAMAAVSICAPFLADAGLAGAVQGLRDFGGVEHRIEACGSANNVCFYNDSKATNVDATEKALRSFDGGVIVLIAGGRDKHSDYGAIRDLVAEKVHVLVTIGEAAPLIEAAWGSVVAGGVLRATSMAHAVELAASNARSGDVVLLSPACASFDMYRNYEERGRDFKAIVAAITAPGGWPIARA